MTKQSNQAESKPRERTVLSISHSDAEIKIDDRINLGKELLDLKILTENQLKDAEEAKKIWHDFNKELLRQIFSTDEYSLEYSNVGLMVASFAGISLSREVVIFFDSVKRYIGRLQSIKERLKIIPEDPKNATPLEAERPQRIITNKVFIVHGHDNEAKESVARTIEALGLVAVILHEQPNQGFTIIEKVEANSDVSFAVVLLTPDDLGKSNKDPGDAKLRARQNVILELGFFIGRLGRNRVCALHKGNIEIPTDFSGIVWVEMDQAGRWKYDLGREMQAAGLNVDLNKIK